MPLIPPKLDTRDFEALIKEARTRIPRYTPEWTNFNESDPGMTLVQLHAWLTETLLFELNRVPELNYTKFLNLIGFEPRPARPARVQLAVTLDKLDKPEDPLAINVPMRTKIAVDDPELPREVVFETDETLRAINADIAAVISHDHETGSLRLSTAYDKGLEWEPSFTPFGPPDPDPGPDSDPWFYVALLVRPNAKSLTGYSEDRLPSGPLDLYAQALGLGDTRSDGSIIEGPLAQTCPQASSAVEPRTTLQWQIHTGDSSASGALTEDVSAAAWTNIPLSREDTEGFTRSGRQVLEIPEGATPLDPSQIDETFWDKKLGRKKAPRTDRELAKALRDPDLDFLEALEKHWETMGVTSNGDKSALAACGTDPDEVANKIDPDVERQPPDTLIVVDPSALSIADWVKIEPAFEPPFPMLDGQLRPLYWLRARQVGGPRVAQFKTLRLNTIAATQAETRLEDALGRSDGRPGQTFNLPKLPVLIDPKTGAPDIDLEIREDGDRAVWTRVDDFYGSGRDDRHYRLDPQTGLIQLGDGRRGRVPVAGSAVVALRYRVGGGAIGNAAPDLVSKLKGRVKGVKAVTNPAPARDGRDAELPDEARLRAPSTLRARERAVSAQDFADLAMEAAVNLHSAYALPRTAVVGEKRDLVERDGAVTVIILPKAEGPRPEPDEAQLRAVCRYLDQRRLVTTELHVRGPDYATVTSLTGRIDVRQGFDLGAVSAAVYDALAAFLDPLTGGEEGKGWPMGGDIYWADLYEIMLGVDGVKRASRLDVRLADGLSGDAVDITPIPEGFLPALSRAVINLEAGYAR